jgi:hypothetical protein
MPRTPLTKTELDEFNALGCQDPHCQHNGTCGEPLYLVQNCHPGAGVDACYDKDKVAVRIECHHCKRFIAEVAVKE